MSHLGIAKGLRETGGPTELAMGAVADGQSLQRSGSTVIGVAGAGGIPGTWTQLGKGPTSVADNTEVTVLAGQAIAAGEVPDMSAVMKDTPGTDNEHMMTRTSVAPSMNETSFGWTKLTVSGNHDFRIRQRSGSARDMDWVALKVVPA